MIKKWIQFFISILVVTLSISLCSTHTLGQRRRGQPTQPRPKQVKPGNEAGPTSSDPRHSPPPKRIFNHNAKIESEYDRFKDISTVTMMREISEPAENKFLEPVFAIGGNFQYRGQTLNGVPQSINLAFYLQYFEGNKRRYSDTFDDKPEVIILADGDRFINLWDKFVSRDAIGYKHEMVGFTFPYKTFLLIANSKKVEVRIGSRKEFQLTENDLEALRDLASRAIP